jgi:hypothetical protein
MKRGLSCAFGLVGWALLTVAAPSVNAKNDDVGPYYATPAWDQTLPSSTRFIVLSNMGSNAVLDRETGLVWERTPISTPLLARTDSWIEAGELCATATTGGRLGWRLPTLPELTSLADPSVPSPGLALPSGHPFVGIDPAVPYWTATSVDRDPNQAWIFTFQNIEPRFQAERAPKSTNGLAAWCVRGGRGTDSQ